MEGTSEARAHADVNFLVGSMGEWDNPENVVESLNWISDLVAAVHETCVVQPARWHDLETVCATTFDGFLSNVGGLDEWSAICRLADVTPPTTPPPGDVPIEQYFERFTLPAAERMSKEHGLPFDKDRARWNRRDPEDTP